MTRSKKEEEFQEGDHVEYHPVGAGENTSTSTGVIQRILTSEETVGTSPHQLHDVDQDHPRYLIKNDKTGKETPYKKMNIVKVLDQ